MTSFSLSVMQNQLATIIPVFELKACNGDDVKLMDVQLMNRVVQCILKMGKRVPFNVVKYPTGLDEMYLENIVLLQQHEKWKVQFVWIVDLGGVGKTTLIKDLIN